MAQLPIKRFLDRTPGGMMIVPLLLGSLISTFFPDTPKFFGSFTGALFTGALPILAVFYVCIGASIRLEATPTIIKKGGALVGTKVAIGVLAGLVLAHLLGAQPITSGMFIRLSTVRLSIVRSTILDIH